MPRPSSSVALNVNTAVISRPRPIQPFRVSIAARDRIVLLIGPTGAGKSTFVKYAAQQGGQTVGHCLQSCTSDIQAVRCNHPDDGKPVVFVDTPGFNDTVTPDIKILSAIASWLTKESKGLTPLSAIIMIYMHRISDNRVPESPLRTLQMFARMCGQETMPRVVICTTMWSEVKYETGVRREEELKSKLWKDMIDNGCSLQRFGDSRVSAWNIINNLSEQSDAKLSDGRVDKKRLGETAPAHKDSRSIENSNVTTNLGDQAHQSVIIPQKAPAPNHRTLSQSYPKPSANPVDHDRKSDGEPESACDSENAHPTSSRAFYDKVPETLGSLDSVFGPYPAYHQWCCSPSPAEASCALKDTIPAANHTQPITDNTTSLPQGRIVFDVNNHTHINTSIIHGTTQIVSEFTSRSLAEEQHHPHGQEVAEIMGPEQQATRPTRNVIVFGDGGMGKSSVINMIAGSLHAAHQNDAGSCTFHNTSYEIGAECFKIIESENQPLLSASPEDSGDGCPNPLTDALDLNTKGFSVTLWDTAGMNDEIPRIETRTVYQNLEKLMEDLQDGVSLLVCCVRGPTARINNTMVTNYELFYSALFQKSVPIVLVITGLEPEDNMEQWWETNEVMFAEQKMTFTDHACVTAFKARSLDGIIGSCTCEEHCSRSVEVVRKLIREHCLQEPWKPQGPTEWLSSFFTAIDSAGVLSKNTFTHLSALSIFSEREANLYLPEEEALINAKEHELLDPTTRCGRSDTLVDSLPPDPKLPITTSGPKQKGQGRAMAQAWPVESESR